MVFFILSLLLFKNKDIFLLIAKKSSNLDFLLKSKRKVEIL